MRHIIMLFHQSNFHISLLLLMPAIPEVGQ